MDRDLIDSLTEQLHALSLLAKRRLLSKSEHSVLKGLVVAKDSRLRSAVDALKESPTSRLGATLDSLRRIAASELEARFNAIFTTSSESTSKQASREERQALGVTDDASLVYGEISWPSFAETLRSLGLPQGGTFVDLGSGSGKPVIAAALLGQFDELIGIELLRSLHAIAEDALLRYTSLQRLAGEAGLSPPPRIRFVRGSFLDEDVSWGAADVVFANSTCFDSGLLHAIAGQCDARLRPGAFVITFTRQLEHPHLQLVSCKQLQQSWGIATVYVCRWNPSQSSAGDDAAAARLAVVEQARDSVNPPAPAPSTSTAVHASSYRPESSGDAGGDYDDADEFPLALPANAFDGWGDQSEVEDGRVARLTQGRPPASVSVPRTDVVSADAPEPPRGDVSIRLDTADSVSLASPTAGRQNLVGAASGALSTPLKSPLGVRARYTPSSRSQGAAVAPPLVSAPLRSLPELSGPALVDPTEVTLSAQPSPADRGLFSDTRRPNDPLPAPAFDDALDRAFVRSGGNLPGAVNCDDDDDGIVSAVPVYRSHNIQPASCPVAAATRIGAIIADDGGWLGGPAEPQGVRAEVPLQVQEDSFLVDVEVAADAAAAASDAVTAALNDSVDSGAVEVLAASKALIDNLWDLPVEPRTRGTRHRPLSGPPGGRVAARVRPDDVLVPSPRSRSVSSGPASLRRPARAAPAQSPARTDVGSPPAPLQRPVRSVTQQGSPGLTPSALQREYEYDAAADEEGLSPFLRGGSRVGSVGGTGRGPASHDGRHTRRTGARAPLGQFDDEAGGDGASDEEARFSSPQASPTRRRRVDGDAHLQGAAHADELLPARRPLRVASPEIASASVAGEQLSPSSLERGLRRQYAEAAAHYPSPPWQQPLAQPSYVARVSPAAEPSRAQGSSAGPDPHSFAGPAANLEAGAASRDAHTLMAAAYVTVDGDASPRGGGESAATERSTGSAPATLVPVVSSDDATRPISSPVRHHLPNSSSFSIGAGRSASGATQCEPSTRSMEPPHHQVAAYDGAADVKRSSLDFPHPATSMSALISPVIAGNLALGVPSVVATGDHVSRDDAGVTAHQTAPIDALLIPPQTEAPLCARSGYAVNDPVPASVAAPSDASQVAGAASSSASVSSSGDAGGRPPLQALAASAHFPAAAEAPAHTVAPPFSTAASSHAPVRHGALVQPSPRHATSPEGFQAAPLSGRQSGGHSSQTSAQPNAGPSFGAAGGADGFLLSGALSSPRTYVSGAHGAGFTPTAFRAVPTPRKTTPRLDYGNAATGVNVGTPPLSGATLGISMNPATPTLVPRSLSSDSAAGSVARVDVSPRVPAQDSIPASQPPVETIGSTSAGMPPVPLAVDPPVAQSSAVTSAPPVDAGSLRPSITITLPTTLHAGALSAGSGHRSARSTTSGTPRNVPKLPLARLTPPVVAESVFFGTDRAMQVEAAVAAAAVAAVLGDSTGVAETAADAAPPPTTGPSPAVAPPVLQLSGRSYISSTESSSDNVGPGEGVTFPVDTTVSMGQHPGTAATAAAESTAAQDSFIAAPRVSAPPAASQVTSAGAAVAAAAFARSAGGADAGTQTDWVDESSLETASKVQLPDLVTSDHGGPLALHIPAGPDDDEESSPRPRIHVTAAGGVVGPPPAALRPLRSYSEGADDSSSPYGAALLRVHRSHSDAGDSARSLPGDVARVRSESRTSSPYGAALLKAHRPLPPRPDEVFPPAIPEPSARSRSDSRADGTSSPFGAALLKAHLPLPSREGEVFSPAIPESSDRSRSDSRADGTSSPYGNALLKAHRPAAGFADIASPVSILDPLQRVRASSVGSIPDRADGSSSPYGSALLKARRALPPLPDEVPSPSAPESTRSRSDSRADGTSSPYGSALLKAHRPLPSREEEVYSPAIPETRSRSDSRADGTSSPFGAALIKAHHLLPSREGEVFSPAIPESSARSRSDSRADGTSSPYGNALLKAHRSAADTAPPVSMLDPVQRVRASSVGSIPDRADGSSSPYGNALLKAHRPLPPRPDDALSPAAPESTRSCSDSRADGTSSPYGSALLKAHRPLPSREEEVYSPAIPETRSRSDSRADGSSSPYGNALLKAHRPADAPSSEVSPSFSDSRSRVRSDDGTSSPYGAALLKAHRPRADSSDLALPLLPAIARVRSESFGDGGSSPVGSALLKAHRQGPPAAPSGDAVQQASAGSMDDSADSSSPGAAAARVAVQADVSADAEADLRPPPAPPSSDGCDMPFPAGAADAFTPAEASRPASDGDGDAGRWAGTPPSDLGAPEDAELLLHGRGSTTGPPVAASAPSPLVPESPSPFTRAGDEGALGHVPNMSLAATQPRQHGGGSSGAAPPFSGSGAGFGSVLASAAAAAALLASAAPSPAAASDAGWAGADLADGDPDADAAAAAAAAAHAGVLGSGSASVASHFSVGSLGAPATLPAASGDYGGGLQSAAPASALGGASEFGMDSSVGGPRSLTTGHSSSSSSAGGGAASSLSGSTSGVGTPSTSAGLMSASTVAGGTGAGGMGQTPPASAGGSAIASPPPMPSGVAVRLDTVGAEEVPSSMASPALRAVVRELHGAELRSWQQQQQQQDGGATKGISSRAAAAAAAAARDTFPYASRSGGPAEPTALPPIPEHGSPAESSPSAAAASPQFDCSSSPQGNVLLALKMRRAAKEGAAGLCEEEEAGGAEGLPHAPLPSALTASSPRSHFAPDFYPASAAAPEPVRATAPPAPELPPPQLQAPPLPRTTAWAAAAASPPFPPAVAAAAAAPVAASPPAPAPASILASPPSVGPFASSASAAAVPLLVISPPSSLGQLGGIAAAFPASARSTARRSITRSHPPSPLSRVPIAKVAATGARPPMGGGGGGLGTGRTSSGAAPVNRRIGLMRSDSMGSEIQDTFLPPPGAPSSIGGSDDGLEEDGGDDEAAGGGDYFEDGGADEDCSASQSLDDAAAAAYYEPPPQTRWTKHQQAAAAAWPPYKTAPPVPAPAPPSQQGSPPQQQQQRLPDSAPPPPPFPPRAPLPKPGSSGDLAAALAAEDLLGTTSSSLSAVSPSTATPGLPGTWDSLQAALPGARYGQAGLAAAAATAADAPAPPTNAAPLLLSGDDVLSPQASSSVSGSGGVGGGGGESSTPHHHRSGSGAVGFSFGVARPPARGLAHIAASAPSSAYGGSRGAGGLDESSELLRADMATGVSSGGAGLESSGEAE